MDYQEDISNARECYEAIRAGLQTKAQRGAGTKAGSTVYTELQYIVPYDKYLYIKDASHVETSGRGFFREKRFCHSYFAKLNRDGSYIAFESELRGLCLNSGISFVPFIYDPNTMRYHAPSSVTVFGLQKPQLMLLCKSAVQL